MFGRLPRFGRAYGRAVVCRIAEKGCLTIVCGCAPTKHGISNPHGNAAAIAVASNAVFPVSIWAGGPPFVASISKSNEGAPPFAPFAKGGCGHPLSGRGILRYQNVTHSIPTSAPPCAIHPLNSLGLDDFRITVSS